MLLMYFGMCLSDFYEVFCHLFSGFQQFGHLVGLVSGDWKLQFRLCVAIGFIFISSCIVVRCVVVRGLVGGASPRAFRWSMLIRVRFTFKTNCITTILDKWGPLHAWQGPGLTGLSFWLKLMLWISCSKSLLCKPSIIFWFNTLFWHEHNSILDWFGFSPKT